MKKRLKMKITTIRQQTIAPAGDSLRLPCPVCEREVEMLSEARAIGILDVRHETLDRLVARRQVHSVESVSGGVWVCKDSLFAKREPRGESYENVSSRLD